MNESETWLVVAEGQRDERGVWTYAYWHVSSEDAPEEDDTGDWCLCYAEIDFQTALEAGERALELARLDASSG